MIYSFIQTKGGTGKTTLTQCLAYSKAFAKAFDFIALIELDKQRTLGAWHDVRTGEGIKDKKVEFFQLAFASTEKIQDTVTELLQKNNCAILLDVPGESTGRFATNLAMALSDQVFFPLRSSTNDEQSFIDNVYPMVNEALDLDPDKKGRVFNIIPAFVHPRANRKNIANHFFNLTPGVVGCLNSFFPQRSIYENFSRRGRTLADHARSVKPNKADFRQAQTAISDIEAIAKEILKLYKGD